jgi:hypothetical protein
MNSLTRLLTLGMILTLSLGFVPLQAQYETAAEKGFYEKNEGTGLPDPLTPPLGRLLEQTETLCAIQALGSYNASRFTGRQARLLEIYAVKRGAHPENAMSPLPKNYDEWYKNALSLVLVMRHPVDKEDAGDVYPPVYLDFHIPYLLLIRSRPITQIQADEISKNSNGNMKVQPATPFRLVEGLRGAYPLCSREQFKEAIKTVPLPGQREYSDEMTGTAFKYLRQTYGKEDVTPLLAALNKLLAALSKETADARKDLEQLKDDPDKVTGEAAAYLLLLAPEKFPRFELKKPITTLPLPKVPQ